MKCIISLLFIFITSFSFSQENEPFIEEVASHLNLTEHDYRFAEIKANPNNPEQSIVMIAKYSELPFDENSEGFDCDLILILVDNKTQTIISKMIEERKYSSDAIQLQGVTLDMANYQVSDNLKAFGVRDSYHGSSQPNPFGSETISLYIIQNNTITRILEILETYNYHGETDMKCYFDGTESNTILIMDKTKTNGFYNIKTKTNTIIKKSRPKKDDDCVDTEKKLKPTFKTLKFAKGEYSDE